MATVYLHLEKENGEEVIVPIIPNNNRLWRKWLVEVAKSVKKYGGAVMEWSEDRIYNFTRYTEEEYLERFNDLIRRVRASHKVFEEMELPITQDKMNHYHHQFELFTFIPRKEREAHGYSKDSSYAFERLNLLIHQWEWRNGPPTIVATIRQDYEKPALEEEDFQHWTNSWEPGSIGLSYCITGKQLVDIWRDNDDIVWENNIRPLNVYSPSFEIYFRHGMFHYENYEEQFYKWWDENEEKLLRLWFKKHDPKNAIGYWIIGKLKNPPEEEEKRVAGCVRVVRVSYGK